MDTADRARSILFRVLRTGVESRDDDWVKASAIGWISGRKYIFKQRNLIVLTIMLRSYILHFSVKVHTNMIIGTTPTTFHYHALFRHSDGSRYYPRRISLQEILLENPQITCQSVPNLSINQNKKNGLAEKNSKSSTLFFTGLQPNVWSVSLTSRPSFLPSLEYV